MIPEEFLADYDARFDWQLPDGIPTTLGLSPAGAFTGRGNHPLEVAFATITRRPRADDMRRAWAARYGKAPNPLLLVAAYEDDGDWKASISGPAGDEPPVESGLELGQVERIAAAALAEPSRHAAIRLLASVWAELENELPGLRNQGMFATHELRDGVPARRDWEDACARGHALLGYRGRELVERLGFSVEPHATAASVLSIAGTKRAVAVFLDEGEEFEIAGDRFAGSSPVSHALAQADREGLPWVVLTRGRQIRVFAARPETGVGRKGRSETFIEANLALLPDDRAGYVPLLFSSDALKERGTFDEILEGSRDYSTGLGARLRERVYTDAVPSLAIALARRHAGELGEDALRRVYEQALTVLFRLLFVAYAEDKDLLPYRSNGAYREHALKTLARELVDRRAQAPVVFDENATDLWDDVAALWLAVDKGNVERGVPHYNGGLFSSEIKVNAAGAALGAARLTNAEFGPALAAMLVDEAEDGVVGPVDFRSLSVREFGTIYEGLLESSLSVAPDDLTLDAKGSYVPERAGDEVVVRAGDVYFHNRSGTRKATGSYFTKPFAVEHLLDQALEPALDDHLARLEALLNANEEAKAAEAFFDFRCVDLAMGSGHFLVAAVDRIEARLSAFLALHPIGHVTSELDRLRRAAIEALGPLGEGVEIEHASLLRRQVARRCVYGVDLNPIAVELARLGIWIHTFVPGLPLSFLDHSLVCGDSLTGIGTLDEAIQALDPEHVPGQASLFRDQIGAVLDRAGGALARLARISEASKAEIDAAREAQAEALAAIQPARDLFDLIIAARLGEAEPLTAFHEAEIAANVNLSAGRRVSRELRSLHFPIAFPEVFLRERGGFDCILGNPPWDKVLFEAQQFWVARAPGLNTVPQSRREAEIQRLRALRPDDATLELREKEERERFQTYAEATFTLRGPGHYDLAKFFVERAISLCGSSGTLGYVLPRQCLVLAGWGKLRRALVDGARISALQARNKRGWLFDDVHHSYMVVLLTRFQLSDQSRDGGVLEIWPGITTVDGVRSAQSGTGTQIPLRDLRDLSDTYVIPWMDHTRAGDIFDLYRRQPSLSSGKGWIQGTHDARWDFRSSGPDHSAVVAAGEGAWRALMTRHVDAYRIEWDEQFRTYVDPAGLALGRGVAPTPEGDYRLDERHPAIIVRHPSRNDDARTLIASLLPKQGVLHNKGYVHAVRHEAILQPVDVLALLGFVNSLTCDWWVRRFVDRHVTAPVVNNLRLPEWDEVERARVATIVSALLRLRDPDLEPCVALMPAEPALAGLGEIALLAEVEVASLAGMGVDRTALDVILEDFSHNGCPSELRRAITERLEA